MARRLVAAVAATLGVAVAVPALTVLTAPAAEAAAYRFWTYWHVSANGSTWDFARVGAASYRPKDGQVEGWRFAVSPGTSSAPAPRLTAATAFDQICDGTPAQDGRKRVAVVVDFGVPAHAPSGDAPPSSSVHGSCVSLPTTASGTAAMAAAEHSMRIEDGMVCGVSGYPRKGCVDAVKEPGPAPATSAPPRGSGGGGGSGGSSGSGTAGGSGSADGGSRGEAPAQRGSAAEPARGTAASASASADARSDAEGGGTPSASAAASAGGVPSADALAASDAPALVDGAPASDPGGGAGGPLPALIGIALVVAIAAGAAFRFRGRRPA